LKSPVFRLLSRAKIALIEMPRMPYGMFNRKFPLPIARAMNKLVFALLFICPNRLLIILPPKFRYLFLMASHSLGLKDKKVEALLKLDFPQASVDLVGSFSNARDYYLHGKIPDFVQKLESVRNASPQIQNQTLRDILVWSFWTLNHKDFDEVNTKVKSFLVSLPKTGEEHKRRYLPQHITNLGHLAMLFLYINYYRQRDPNRIIVLPENKSANDYYLKLLCRHSPLEIQFAKPEVFSKLSPTQVDTLHYSLDVNNEYRTESDAAAFYSNCEHPEFEVQDDFILSLNSEEQSKGTDYLRNYLGYAPLWFIILHVREPKNRDLTFAQARDANIFKYWKLAKHVTDLGGLVVRMGDSTFPRIDKDFMAFDYAYSQLKSEFMDVWLWANARFWVGTPNGAAFPPITFGTKRLITDQWYWQEGGPKTDMVLRKGLENHTGLSMDNSEYSRHRFSRTMDYTVLKRQGYKLKNCDEDKLKFAMSCRLNDQSFKVNALNMSSMIIL